MSKENIYALYKGDKFIDLGTKKELAEKMGYNPETIGYFASPTYYRKIAKRKNSSNSLIAIRIEDD